jgi:hypothetical protein
MAKRSARTAASLSSGARAGLLESLRTSDRCCTSSEGTLVGCPSPEHVANPIHRIGTRLRRYSLLTSDGTGETGGERSPKRRPLRRALRAIG